MSPTSITPSSVAASSPSTMHSTGSLTHQYTASNHKDSGYGMTERLVTAGAGTPENGSTGAPEGGPASNGDKPQRSRDGCLTCRQRKVKCNEERPVCDKCRIKSRECVWPSGDESERRRNKKRRTTNLSQADHDNVNSHSPSGSNGTRSVYPDLPNLHLPPLPLIRSPSNRGTISRRIKGIVHVPPGFLPPDSMDGKGKEKEGNLVDWLVPEKMRAGLMMDPSFLEPYFPTVDERLVIRHYLSKTVHIIIAFESPHRPWNPWLAVHAPLAFKHLPGTNPAADALRAAMLAVGGVHLTYTCNPTDQAAAWRITKSATSKVLKLIEETLTEKNGKPKVLQKENIELVLAALLSCTIASSLAADDAWHHLLSTVLNLIVQLGGAQNILRDAPRDRLSPYRFFMEQLAIRDVFGCMTTELAPSILRDAFTPWFFEAEMWSRTDLEWESVERMFGISRGMVDMIARACSLISSVRSINKSLTEAEPSPHDPVLGPLQHAAQALMAEIKVWDEAENFTPLHPRTQYGNHSYKHAIRIRMLRKVYNVSSDDERVVKSSQAIIELAGEMLALYGKITWLTWPILIAGFEIPVNHPSRVTALEMLGAFGPHACFDNRTAARMLSDYWMWHDMDGDHVTSWEVARTLNQRPFLD
ncbi:hypothetical protein I317_00155 [Kwoniella heveanensis CBS 569]|nr:hypothetical protein I317_00155 [Kwoniella heveanensis CBS 569]